MKRELIFLVFISLSLSSPFIFFIKSFPFLSSSYGPSSWPWSFYPLFPKLQRLLKKKDSSPPSSWPCWCSSSIVLPSRFSWLLWQTKWLTAIIAWKKWSTPVKFRLIRESKRDFYSQVGLERLGNISIFRKTDPLPYYWKDLQKISTFIFIRTATLLKGSLLLSLFFFTLLSLYYFSKMEVVFQWMKEIVPLHPRRGTFSSNGSRTWLCNHLWRDSDWPSCKVS